MSCIVAIHLAILLQSRIALQSAESPIKFTNVTASSGLEMSTVSGSVPSAQILEAKGSGLALIDADQDGDLDIFVPNGSTMADPEHGPGSRLFENLGKMKFRDATPASGITNTRWGFGATVGDYDNDGMDDIYMCCYGPDVLLKGLGGLRFADATKSAGLGTDDDWSTSAAFCDLDQDGDLDLFVTNYLQFDCSRPAPATMFKGVEVMFGPRGLPPSPDRLHENLGGGKFQDRSDDSGIRAAPPSFGLNSVVADFTGDGLPDMFVANDSMADQLWQGQGGMHFVERGKELGLATNQAGREQASMGLAVGDVNADALPDLYVTVFSSDTNTLHVSSQTSRGYTDKTPRYGVGSESQTLLGWAAMFADLDHDTSEDLVVFNGHVYPQATRDLMDSDYLQPALVFRREGDRFHRGRGTPAFDEPHCDRAAVWADLDDDGDLDAVVAELNGPLRLLRNDHDRSDDWVIVSLEDGTSGSQNRHGIGAVVTLEQAGVTQTRWMLGGGPFQSNHPPEVHFGVRRGEPCTVNVTWPLGGKQRIEGVSPGSRLRAAR